MYSKLSVIRPGHSRFLEFGKKILSTGCLIETFSKYPDQNIYSRVQTSIENFVFST